MHDSLRTQLQHALGNAYELDRELTGGGMSRVFVARERALDRDVVVKVLPPDLAAGVNRERFRREIQLAAQLQHPHIVPLLSAGESGELLYYTMPFIAGESLRAAIEARGALSVRDVVRILHDVVDALAYAHERGVIHRDIKPANILMSGTHALITDFGVAKALSASLPVAGVTTSGIAIGTPAYMAPEQLAGDPKADHRVDVYAVGLLAYELLTGASPFSSLSPQQTMAAQLTRMPEPLAEVRPEVPASLSRLITRCLEKNPDDRPANARELLSALDTVSTPQGLVFAGAQGATRERRTARTVGAAAVVVTLGVVSAVALTLGRRPAANDSTRAASAGAVQSGTPAAAPLTHDDSLAIAAAVQRRMVDEATSGIAPATTDSLRVVLERAFADSVQQARIEMRQEFADSIHAFADSVRTNSVASALTRVFSSESPRAPKMAVVPMTPRVPLYMPEMRPSAPVDVRRIAVAGALVNAGSRLRDQIDPFTTSLADSLRAGLGALSGFTLVPNDSVRPANGSADALRIARESGAGVGVAGLVLVGHDGRAVVHVFVADLRHGWRYNSMNGDPVPVAELPRTMPALVAHITQWLTELPPAH